MSLYYIDTDDEYRDCESCDGSGYAPGCTETDRLRGDLWACLLCDGTGKLGDPDAKPEIWVWEMKSTGKWRADTVWPSEMFIVEDSEAEALEAAREALK